jgi:hypothetical protein
MKCDDLSLWLGDSCAWTDPGKRRLVIEHLAACEECRAALTAVDALHELRKARFPQPSADAIARTVRAAMSNGRASYPGFRGFWAGLAVGAAAAGIVAIAWLTMTVPQDQPEATVPEVRMALHQMQRVSIAIESPEALSAASIHVSLRGAIDIEGFEGLRDIRWTTDLERGINELTLPVVALAQGGGQLIVEVHHGDRRKTFLVDVHAGGPTLHSS